ncbi:MAG: pectate lyase [Muribaculaceae bacterium]|nr:pectate lyase [Muribaculaceae bacterium]
MKGSLLLAGALALCTPLFAQEQAPAFPGAEGHGRFTTGGRGGQIIHVTNLNDSGEGSLRWALAQSGPKTIVFDVSGYIDLKSQLNVTSNTTIAGQTAPEGGITLRYYTLYFGQCDNVIVRFIRSRRSQVKDVNDGADATWGRRRKNIILDHCSFSWSIDEVASFYDNRNFTMQWCTIGEGLANPGHSKGAHSYGGIWGGKEASFHHNYLTHIQNRAPRFNGARYEWDGWDKTRFENTVDAERVDFRNNVLYNWGNGNGSYGGPGGGYINIVNNYYQAGPGTKNKTRVTEISVGSSGNSTNDALRGLCSRYYIDGNYVAAASAPESYDWKGVKYDNGVVDMSGTKVKEGHDDGYVPDPKHKFGENVEYVQIQEKDHVKVKLDEPIDAGIVTTQSAETVYNKVLDYCGASLYRDAVDARYMEEARTGTVTYHGKEAYVDKNGKVYPTSNTEGILDFINDPEKEENPNTASFPVLPNNVRPDGFDTDMDGMPDEWETANGLNPNDPEDANLYTVDSKGTYTNVEVYLNQLVEDIMKAGNADAISAVDEYYPECVKMSGVETIETTKGDVVAVEYYDLNGMRLAEPAQGISIRRIIFANGTSETDKVLKK